MQIKELGDFYLVGGSALALRLGHRLSVDLDLFSGKDIDTKLLPEVLKKYFALTVTGEIHNTLNLFLNGIKADLISFKYPLISEILMEDGIRIAGLPDIAAMKLSVLAQRGSRKDFYDIYFLLKEYSLGELFKFFQQKFAATELFHVVKSLTYFDDAEPDPDPILIAKVEWSTVKKELQNAVKTI